MSLLTSRAPDGYQARRHLKKSETRPVLPKHRVVLELHLCGLTAEQVAQKTGYSVPAVYTILSREDIIGLRQQIMAYYDQEFEALFPDVIIAVREGLCSDDMGQRLDAAKTWLKAHGKFSSEPKQGQQINLTAEDIVVNILNQRSGDEVSLPNTAQVEAIEAIEAK